MACWFLISGIWQGYRIVLITILVVVREFPLAGFEEACCYACSACTEGREPGEASCCSPAGKGGRIDVLQRADPANNLISLEPDPALAECMMSLPPPPSSGQHLDGRGLS